MCSQRPNHVRPFDLKTQLIDQPEHLKITKIHQPQDATPDRIKHQVLHLQNCGLQECHPEELAFR